MKDDPFDADSVLGVNPFDGDFGDGEVLVSDAIVEAPTCNICDGPIRAGTKVRHRVEWTNEHEKDDDEFKPAVSIYLFCQPCCRAVAVFGTNPGRLERRSVLGVKRRAKRSQ